MFDKYVICKIIIRPTFALLKRAVITKANIMMESPNSSISMNTTRNREKFTILTLIKSKKTAFECLTWVVRFGSGKHDKVHQTAPCKEISKIFVFATQCEKKLKQPITQAKELKNFIVFLCKDDTHDR